MNGSDDRTGQERPETSPATAEARGRPESRRPRRGRASPATPERAGGDGRSVADLLRELRDEGATLLRQEVALAKAEMTEKLMSWRRGAIALGIGAALLVAALLPLVETLVRGLTVLLEGAVGVETAVWLAPLIVAVVLGGIGYAVLRSGTRTLSEEGVVPERTLDSLDEDRQWAEEKTRRMKRSVKHG